MTKYSMSQSLLDEMGALGARATRVRVPQECQISCQRHGYMRKLRRLKRDSADLGPSGDAATTRGSELQWLDRTGPR